jgi:hypothetical protein
VALELEDRQVWVGGWLYVVNSWVDDGVPVLLLDTDLPVNDPRDRASPAICMAAMRPIGSRPGWTAVMKGAVQEEGGLLQQPPHDASLRHRSLSQIGASAAGARNFRSCALQ